MTNQLHVICDDCSEILKSPDDGFSILGNIGKASSDEFLGLIGNNFPTPSRNGNININYIHKVDLCIKCFKIRLGL